MNYQPNNNRYQNMKYNRCGYSGLKLPLISLGLWHNFGSVDDFDNAKAMLLKAFDLGITHFDLANNYGPNPGSAEETLGKVLKAELNPYRNELVISTKAGYGMWPGPYGDFGSKKYLISSLDASLKRLGLDYVDIFYHHRPDHNTPLEETMNTLDLMVRQGKALYVGISNYNAEDTKKAADILKQLGTPCLINQSAYSMFNRSIENGLTDVCSNEGIGIMAFMPLAQGLLTNKYLKGIPTNSRAAGGSVFLNTKDITSEKLDKINLLNDLAMNRGQSLAQLAIAWVLRYKAVTSALIGASRPQQIEENVNSLNNLTFSDDELSKINTILNNK